MKGTNYQDLNMHDYRLQSEIKGNLDYAIFQEFEDDSVSLNDSA